MKENLSEYGREMEENIMKILAYSLDKVQLVYWKATVIPCGGGDNEG
jgi:hypothetical protein